MFAHVGRRRPARGRDHRYDGRANRVADIDTEKPLPAIPRDALASAAAGQPTGTPTRAPADSTAARITIIIDQQPVSFEHDGSKPILDAALDAGLNVPFACKGGVCCTCRAKVMEGEVDMAVNYNLEEEEVAAGYVLTCQSFPKSGKVVLNFDA